MRLEWTASLTALALVACSGGDASGREDDGPVATRDFTATGFDKVDLAGADDVTIQTGGDFAVRAKGPQAVLDRLEVEVVGSTLRIRRERTSGWNWGNRKGATIAVTMPTATGASVSGAGDLTLDRGTGDFIATVSGAGDLTVGQIAGGNVTLRVSGSGDIAAAGSAQTLRAGVSGAGNVRAGELVARRGEVSVSGVGDISARIDGPAKVSVSGVGSANLGPNAVCDIRKSGVGDVKCGGQ